MTTEHQARSGTGPPTRPTIIVDPEDRGTQTGTMLPPPPGWKPTPIREMFDEPLDPAGECCVLEGKPCILFGMLDYAEDWSGEFVREVHPFTLLWAPKVTAEEFWKLVRATSRKGGD
jgi:hypothetical protein